MIGTELPDGWQKTQAENGKIYYYDQKNNSCTSHHPLTKKFRNFFHEILKFSFDFFQYQNLFS